VAYVYGALVLNTPHDLHCKITSSKHRKYF